jgi:hypothetical protein
MTLRRLCPLVRVTRIGYGVVARLIGYLALKLGYLRGMSRNGWASAESESLKWAYPRARKIKGRACVFVMHVVVVSICHQHVEL